MTESANVTVANFLHVVENDPVPRDVTPDCITSAVRSWKSNVDELLVVILPALTEVDAPDPETVSVVPDIEYVSPSLPVNDRSENDNVVY